MYKFVCKFLSFVAFNAIKSKDFVKNGQLNCCLKFYGLSFCFYFEILKFYGKTFRPKLIREIHSCCRTLDQLLFMVRQNVVPTGAARFVLVLYTNTGKMYQFTTK
jgi:hypothetical protein